MPPAQGSADWGGHASAPASTRRPPRVRRLVFRAVVVGLTLFVLGFLLVASDFILFWYDQTFNNDIVLRVRDRVEKGPGIYESVPSGKGVKSYGLRLRRLNTEDHYDAISRRTIEITTNALGYRSGPILPKEPGEFRILVLGDSITLAAYLDEHETYPACLERRLKPRVPSLRVINAGVSGASLNGALHVLTESGLLVEPDIVLVGMYINDACPSPLYEPRHGLLSGSALAKRVEKISRHRAYEKDTRRWYEALSGKPFPDEEFPENAWRSDRAAFEAEIAKACWDWGNSWYPWAWEQLRVDLEQFQALQQKYRFQLVVFLFPCTFQVEAEFLDDTPQRSFEAVTSELGVLHCDLLPAMRAKYQEDRASQAFDHCHLRPEANDFVAGIMAAFLERAGMLSAAAPAAALSVAPAP